MSMNCGGHDLLGTPKAYKNPINWKTRLNIALNAAQGSKHCDQSHFLYIHYHYISLLFQRKIVFYLLLNHFH